MRLFRFLLLAFAPSIFLAGPVQRSVPLTSVTTSSSPWVRFQNPIALPTPPSARNLGTPLTLTTADFDSDGTPDLAAGYASATGGVIALYRGNAGAVFPNSPEARLRNSREAFLSNSN